MRYLPEQKGIQHCVDKWFLVSQNYGRVCAGVEMAKEGSVSQTFTYLSLSWCITARKMKDDRTLIAYINKYGVIQ